VATTVDALIFDLLDWIGSNPRPYNEVIEAWRTSCPRLPVWEEANERGFVERSYLRGRGAYVCVSALGMEFLGAHRQVKDLAAGFGGDEIEIP
jgi:D-3-phosphoglycerate dehydrogenase / 2-oxoglutarate reductase